VLPEQPDGHDRDERSSKVGGLALANDAVIFSTGLRGVHHEPGLSRSIYEIEGCGAVAVEFRQFLQDRRLHRCGAR